MNWLWVACGVGVLTGTANAALALKDDRPFTAILSITLVLALVVLVMLADPL